MVHRVKSGGNQAQASKSPFPVELHKLGLISPAMSCDQGSSLETQCLECVLGTGCIGILSLAYTKILDSPKESRCSA